MKVAFIDLLSQQREIAEGVKSGWEKVISTSSFIGGPFVKEFESAYASRTGVSHCIGVANGTDAMELCLRAVEVGPGDEVILPANSFVATAEAVARVGAVPVVVDVDPEHLLIDPDHVAAAITKRTKAIVPVHLFGQTAPVEMLQPIANAHGLVIIEDAAQSQGATRHGRPAGSLGTLAATSFYPGKNLGAYGDAGAVLTNQADLARRIRMLGAHGSEIKYVHEFLGFNSRLDALQAVVLTEKLKRLNVWNARRREAARRYSELLSNVSALKLPRSANGNEDVWHLYVVRLKERDKALADLQSAAIGTGVHYPLPIHKTPAFESLAKVGPGGCKIAERAAEEILSLPLCPYITAEAQHYVADVLAKTVTRQSAARATRRKAPIAAVSGGEFTGMTPQISLS